MTTDEDTKSATSVLTVRRIFLVAFTALMIGGFYFWRPYWHDVWYGLAYVKPEVPYWMTIGLAISLIAVLWTAFSARNAEDTETTSRTYSRPGLTVRIWKRATSNMSGKQTLLFVLGGIIIVFFGLFAGPLAGSVSMNVDKSNEVTSSVTDIDTLPETDANQPRILPKEVAYQYAQNSLQYPRHHLEGGDITYVNGTQHWSWGLAPDGAINSLWAQQQAGGVYVNMTTSGSDVTVQENEFATGQGMVAWRNYEWQMLKDDYWVDLQDPMMVPHEGDQYIAVPYIEHDHRFTFTPLPQVYSVPEFGGVKLMDTDGNIEDVSPDEVQNHPALQDQRVYPYELAKFEVESTRYQHGAINKWFKHEDELELAATPGEDNDQPFTVTTEDGIKYVTAAEPWGDSSGVYQVWVHDAQTGAVERLQVPVSSSMTGPTAATEYTMTEIDRAGLEPVEPIPVVVDGTLYWQVKVLPDDGRGIRFTAFVNAESNDVTLVREDADVRAFLAADDVDVVEDPSNPDAGDETGGEGESGDSTLTIVIERADGTTEEIEVEEGSTVTIEHGSGTPSDSGDD